MATIRPGGCGGSSSHVLSASATGAARVKGPSAIPKTARRRARATPGPLPEIIAIKPLNSYAPRMWLISQLPASPNGNAGDRRWLRWTAANSQSKPVCHWIRESPRLMIRFREGTGEIISCTRWLQHRIVTAAPLRHCTRTPHRSSSGKLESVRAGVHPAVSNRREQRGGRVRRLKLRLVCQRSTYTADFQARRRCSLVVGRRKAYRASGALLHIALAKCGAVSDRGACGEILQRRGRSLL